MKKFNKESGQALVVVAMSGMVLLGFVALATDVGVLLHAKKQMQSAADSAALAGAYEFTLTGTYSSAVQEGLADAANNGYSSTNCPASPNTSGATVCIKEPTNDSHAAFNNPGYVEADISAPTPTPFINAFWTWFTPGYTPMTVSARAVAVSQGGGAGVPNGCIDTLSPNAADAMDFQGSFTVKVPGCPVNDRSNNSDALQFTGGGGTLNACGPNGTGCGSVGVVGGDGGHPSDSTPAPVTGVATFSDPMNPRELSGEMTNLTSSCGAAPANLLSGTSSAPFTPAWRSITPANGQMNTVPGTTGYGSAFPAYNAVCYSGAVTLDTNATTGTGYLAGGVYVFTGAVTLNGLQATGITLVIANGGSLTVSPQANEHVNITAPPLNVVSATSPNGDDNLWNGMLIYQPASNTTTINGQVGSSSAQFSGIIYAPGAQFLLQDSGGDKNGGITFQTNLIVNTFEDKTASMTITCYTCAQEGSSNAGVFSRVTLVE